MTITSETIGFNEVLLEIELFLKCKQLDRFNDIKVGNISLDPFMELLETIRSITYFYIRGMAVGYDGFTDITEDQVDDKYEGLVAEFVEKAKAERDRLCAETREAIMPYLNLETDTSNRYGWTKKQSETVLKNLEEKSPNANSVFSAIFLFNSNPKTPPSANRVYFKVRNIEEELRSIRERFQKELYQYFDLYDIYISLCDKALAKEERRINMERTGNLQGNLFDTGDN